MPALTQLALTLALLLGPVAGTAAVAQTLVEPPEKENRHATPKSGSGVGWLEHYLDLLPNLGQPGAGEGQACRQDGCATGYCCCCGGVCRCKQQECSGEPCK